MEVCFGVPTDLVFANRTIYFVLYVENICKFTAIKRKLVYTYQQGARAELPEGLLFMRKVGSQLQLPRSCGL